MKTRLPIRSMCYIAIFTAVIAACAQLTIPMPAGVPLTLQTFAIMLTGVVLGAKKGTAAVVVYLLLGMVGAPVFQNFTGGLGVVFGPTGGFILSFPIIAFATGLGAARKNIVWLAMGLVGGVAVNYFCGMVYFSFNMETDLYYAFTVCVLPFLVTDLIKLIMAAVLGKLIKTALVKNKLLT